MQSKPSCLDQPGISGRYLFPQSRRIPDPFLVAVDGAELACYRRMVDPDCFTLVHFHGNGEAVADYLPGIANRFAALGLNLLFVEYREYGGSSGQARLVSMLGDGELVLRAAGVTPERAIVFGRSMGSLYALELAHRQPAIAGVILESGIADPTERFLTYADLNAAGVQEEELVVEAKKYFDHERKLAAYNNPLLIMHTERDGLVDISHAERNYRWSGSTHKRFIRFPSGTHNTIMAINQDAYWRALQEFVEFIAKS